MSGNSLLHKMVQTLEELEPENSALQLEQDLAIAAYYQFVSDQKIGLISHSVQILAIKRITYQITEVSAAIKERQQQDLGQKRKLFRTNQIQQLIEHQQDTAPENAALLLISGKFSDVNRRWRMGTIAYEERNVLLAKARQHLWHLIFDEEQSPETP